MLFGSARITNIKLTEYFYSATAEVEENVAIEFRFLTDLDLVEKVIKPGTEIHYDGEISGDRKQGNWIVVNHWSLLSDYDRQYLDFRTKKND